MNFQSNLNNDGKIVSEIGPRTVSEIQGPFCMICRNLEDEIIRIIFTYHSWYLRFVLITLLQTHISNIKMIQ